MSRVGNKIIPIPTGVTVSLNANNNVTVKGPKGTLTDTFNEKITIVQEGNEITIKRADDLLFTRSIHGTTRALLNNMIIGVSTGFSKTLELVGVGYRAALNGKGITLSLGYSHPIEIAPVDGITFKIEGQNKVTVEGIEKEVVGQVAANIRGHRPPEPYKGKGVKYSNEIIRRKEGKKG